MNKLTINMLADAVIRFVEEHPDPLLNSFKRNLALWGDSRLEVPPQGSPVADILNGSGLTTTRRTSRLIELFVRYHESLHWEQSYTREDGVVGEEMLAGYGFVELIGKRGPCVSERVRCGLGVWDAGIDYPEHRHQAEEIYVVLGGSASFKVGTAPRQTARPEDAVFVSSNQFHGFRTGREPLIVLYLWQNGDLRQTSCFSRHEQA